MKFRRRVTAVPCGALVAPALSCGAAAAQRERQADTALYPTRPVRLIVPFAPGGSDVAARRWALMKYSGIKQESY